MRVPAPFLAFSDTLTRVLGASGGWKSWLPVCLCLCECGWGHSFFCSVCLEHNSDCVNVFYFGRPPLLSALDRENRLLLGLFCLFVCACLCLFSFMLEYVAKRKFRKLTSVVSLVRRSQAYLPSSSTIQCLFCI